MGAGSAATLALKGCTESLWIANEGAAGRLLSAKEPQAQEVCRLGALGPGDRPVQDRLWPDRGLRRRPAGVRVVLSTPAPRAFVPSQRAVPRIKAPPRGACCLVRGGSPLRRLE